jgi:hypothetical protein
MSRLLLAVVFALALCPAAEAATTVARKGAFTLHATERGDRLCMTLRRAGHYRGQVCGRVPRSPLRTLPIFPDVGWNDYAVAVPPSVRVAETESRAGRRERHRTSTARGFSARFVILPAPPAAVFVRYYGADGALLGMEGGPAGYISPDNQTRILGGPDDGVEVHTEPAIAPTPEDAGHLRTEGCLDFRNGNSGLGTCEHNGEDRFALLGECEQPDLAAGLVGPGVAAVRLTLGSGAEMRIETGELPAAFAGRRAAATFLPAGEAVREVAALDAGGAVVARSQVGTPPGGQPCPGEAQGTDSFGGPLVPVSAPSGAVAVASAGGESLVVADQGERLCSRLGRLRAEICPPPPADSDRPRLLWRRGVVAGVLSRDAARIRLLMKRGPDVTVGTTEGGAYTGRWAGDVRFFAASVGSDRRVVGAVVRNAAGRIIGISRRVFPRPTHRTMLAERDGRGVVLVGREGNRLHPCLRAFAVDLPQPRSTGFCTIERGQLIDGPFLAYRAAVTVPCAPRLPVAYGRMPDRFPAPDVLLEGGRTVRAQRISLRGEDGFVAFLPDARILGLRSGDRRVPLDLPPASAQCGYSAVRSF